MHLGLAAPDLVRLAIFAALFLAMAGWFFHAVRWRDFRIALARLPKPEKIFLMLIGGCFLAGSSAGYRGIHLLFTLPGLLAMARMEDDSRVHRAAIRGCVLVVALTWAGLFTWNGLFQRTLESWIGNIPGTRLVHLLWYISQIAWWLVATFFIAILIGCCSDWFAALPNWRRTRAEN
jgi:hypothetical protein